MREGGKTKEMRFGEEKRGEDEAPTEEHETRRERKGAMAGRKRDCTTTSF